MLEMLESIEYRDVTMSPPGRPDRAAPRRQRGPPRHRGGAARQGLRRQRAGLCEYLSVSSRYLL